VDVRPDVLTAIAVLGLVSYLCRAGGYFLMGYVRVTARVEAWLNAIPMAIMGAILGPIAFNGGPAEWAGLVAAVGLKQTTGSDFVSILGAVAAVAAVRQLL
jgi:uncharacterized membrane protein